jgi:hypothetical protein
MSFATGHAKSGGRKKGARNKRTVAAAPQTYPDALEHLAKIVATTPETDPTITPELRLRAAIGLAQYQHPKPWTSRFIGPIDGYEAPRTVDEARATILELGARLAKREISVEAHDALVNGLRVYLGDRAAEQQRQLDRLEDALRTGES